MNLFWVATAGAIGCNLGSLVAYEVGHYGGRPLVELYGRWILMGRRELDWADRFFARWGHAAVFVARLLPVIRTGRSSKASAAVTSRTTAGTSCRPASCAARQRRSPAMRR